MLKQTSAYDHLINELIDTDPDHHHLKHSGVTFAVLEKDGDLKLHGYPCVATVAITPLKQRELGVADIVITVDADEIAMIEALEDGEDRLRALFDHELYHVEVQIDDWQLAHNPDGTVMRNADSGEPVKIRAHYKFDASHRPKLKMRKHDIQVGWFSRMVEKHGDRSAEIVSASRIVDSFGQLLFGFSATEQEIALSRDRFNKRRRLVPDEFHAHYNDEEHKRDREMIGSHKKAKVRDFEEVKKAAEPTPAE